MPRLKEVYFKDESSKGIFFDVELEVYHWWETKEITIKGFLKKIYNNQFSNENLHHIEGENFGFDMHAINIETGKIFNYDYALSGMIANLAILRCENHKKGIEFSKNPFIISNLHYFIKNQILIKNHQKNLSKKKKENLKILKIQNQLI